MELGLIGERLEHSHSKTYFEEKFKKEGLEASYELFELEKIEDFPDLLKSKPNLRGLNVTIPYKVAIMDYLDAVNRTAEEVGAVNTIDIRDGKLTGYNTDVYGFSKSVHNLLPEEMDDPLQVLVLGTGGAARAVEYVMKNEFDAEVTFATRKPSAPNHVKYNKIRKIEQYHLIVNCTPLGNYPLVNQCPDIPYSKLKPDQVLYDLIYNPAETLFMKIGIENGCTVKNGLEMLHLQADAAWEIWSKD